MNQKPKPGHLFFTPRTPWGTRLNHQSFKRHLRASEDQVPYPASKTIQDLDEEKEDKFPPMRMVSSKRSIWMTASMRRR